MSLDKIKIALQYALPKHALSRLAGKFAAAQAGWFTTSAIRAFIRAYDINMAEAKLENASDFATFNEFFTRELKPDARSFVSDDKELGYPVDGKISQQGKIIDDQLIQAKGFDYQQTLQDLAEVLKLRNMELCLFTSEGEKPYFHIDPHQDDTKLCTETSCESCKASPPFNSVETLGFSSKFPINRHDRQYGIIKVKHSAGTSLPKWQNQLLRSCADQLAIALSLQETKEQEHRLAMLSERTVIARELHDSLAQSLSYLKIQVTRLQKSHDMEKFERQQPIIDELREGLSSAYRHLRELLTTFRLKIDDEGLEGAILQTVNQLKARSDMDIQLNYALKDVPLSPSEEIHLLQILREASQNATNHSQGKNLKISLFQHENKNIELVIKDDGIGLPKSPEKLNHYGLAIIKERSRHLHATLLVNSTPKNSAEHGNTEIKLHFKPRYLIEQDNKMNEH